MTAVAAADQHATGQPPGRIAGLNDELRRTGRGGRVVITAGVAALPEAERAAVLAAARAFERFNPDNDPYGDHDFGKVEVGSLHCFWKIDGFDRDLRFGSPDPADPAVTVRVLTLMLAEEY